MSTETMEWLNQNTLIGFATDDLRGKAWHYRKSDQGDEPNHYDGAIPVEDVKRRLFDWEPLQVPIYAEIAAQITDEGVTPATRIVMPDRKAIIRSDNHYVMGLFKDGYEPHPYGQWLVDTVAAILDDKLSIGSAGLLKNGAQAWVQVEVPESITTPEGVEFRPNLLACTSFDGSLATTFKRCITDVVCDNTKNAALREKGQQYKVRHSRYSKNKLADARDALNVVYTMADDFAADVKALCEIDVSEKEWMAFLDAYVPYPDDDGKSRGRTLADTKRGQLMNLWYNDNRVSPWKNTAYGVVQDVNTWAHHVAGTRGEASRAERNMEKTVVGDFDTLDRDVLGTLTKVLDINMLAAA